MTVIKPAALPTSAGNAVGSSGEGLFILSGVVVAAAGWRLNHSVGEWWWRVVIGSAGLAIVASMTNRTKAAPIVKGLAWITFLAACMYAIPAFKSGSSGAGGGSHGSFKGGLEEHPGKDEYPSTRGPAPKPKNGPKPF